MKEREDTLTRVDSASQHIKLKDLSSILLTRRCCLWLSGSPGNWREGARRQVSSLSAWKLSPTKAVVLSIQVLSHKLMKSGIFDLSFGVFSAASKVQLKQKFASPRKFSFTNISKESPCLQNPHCIMVGEDRRNVSQLFSFPSQLVFPCCLRLCQNYWHLDHGKLYRAQTGHYLRQNIKTFIVFLKKNIPNDLQFMAPTYDFLGVDSALINKKVYNSIRFQ